MAGSGKVPGQVPNHGFREGSGAGSERQVPGQVPNHVPNHGFQEGSGAGSEPRVPGRFRGRFRTTGSGKVPGQFFEPCSEPRTTGSRKVPGQVPIHQFREEYSLCLNIQHI